MRLTILRALNILFVFLGFAVALSARTTQTVSSVTTAITLSGEVDYHITGATPISSTGSIDIQNEEAWVFFDNVVPSSATSYLSKITVNGVAAKANSNVMVSIYKQGAVLIPHGTNYFPLTVYTGENYTGESKNDFAVFTYYKSLGTFDNAIKSFKLKRGYMATFANNAAGTGYSRCFIADDEDIEVPVLQGELNGKVSFIRVFRWRWNSKKGYAGGDATVLNALNATWFCDWNIGGDGSGDYAYALHRHHIGWPSYTDINNRTEVTHLLGDNEPDNTSDANEAYHTVSEVLAQWESMYASGLRVGSPACTSASTWLYSFVDSCDARGYRLDFVALHCYWYNDASSWRSQLQNIYNRVKRPLWITEWNYGANWTGSPFSDPDNPTSNDYQIHLQKIREILAVLDELPFVECYAFYNWVQEARKFYKSDGTLTPSGAYYASTKPDYFFNRDYEVIPKAVYTSLKGLSTTFTPANSTVKLAWTDNNRELTDSSLIERNINDGEYEVISTVYNSSKNSYTFTDTLHTGAGVYTYRVRAFGADGKVRSSNTSSVSLSGAEGSNDFQYGKIETNSTAYTYNYYQSAFDEIPAVIMGPVSNNNTNPAPCQHIYQIKDNYFQFRYYPWINSDYTTLTSEENSSYLVVKKGNGSFGNMKYECKQIEQKIGRDTVEVLFDQPFDEGVTPIVFASVYTSHTSHPFMWKIWNVTNTGFSIRLCREAGIDAATFLKEYVNYFAITPGHASMGNGKQITAGMGDNTIGKILRTIKFGRTLTNPYLFAEPQTANDNLASILRYASLNDSCVKIRRHVDTSASGVAKYDEVGWMVISDDDGTGIGAPTIAKASNLTLSATKEELIVEDAAATSVSFFAITGVKVKTEKMINGKAVINLQGLQPGTYIVNTSNGHSKLFLKK